MQPPQYPADIRVNLGCFRAWNLSVLLSTLEHLTDQRRPSLPAPRQTELLHHLAASLVEFQPRPGQDGQLGGSVPGSLAWRLARGETGPDGRARHPAVRRLCDSRHSERNRQLRAARSLLRSRGSIRGKSYCLQGITCRSLVYEARDVARKEEQDWMMVYLARREGADTAKIS